MMEKQEFENIVKEKMKLIDIEISNEQVEQFYRYMHLLIEWNEKMNLTAIVEPNEIILKHFIDSVTIAKYIKDKKTLIDVGTGAGFPGIPLKIVNPKINMTLLDSLNKRIMFLKELIEQLGLENINVFHGRAEEFAQNKEHREKYEVVTSRAVANLSTLSEYMIPFAKENGIIISMKGSEVQQELDEAKNAIKILGGKVEKVDSFSLLDTEIKRNNVIIKKERLTPRKYPRKAGIPAKEPLK